MALRHRNDSTLSLLLHRQAVRQPEAPAVMAPGRTPLTYAGLARQVGDVAAALAERGFTPSTRVAIVLPNGPEMATAFLGVASGAVCAPLNPAYQAAEFRFFLEDSRANAIVVTKGERGPARHVADEMGLAVLEIEADLSLAAGRFAIGAASGTALAERPPALPDDLALILHTSGTTARPKIVPLSQANLVASARNIANWLALEPSDRCLNVMPLFHIHGLVGALLATLAGGSSIVCAPGFDDHTFFDWVAQFEPSWYTAVPTIHQAVVAQGGRYRQVAPRHQFRFVRSSSAALPPTAFESLQALTGAPIIESYGMTEASHQMASNPLAGPCKPGSVGVAAGVELALMDEAGRLLPPDATGEVVIRGPGVTAGYENNPEANVGAFTDGWFRTGDLGRLDAEGYLYLLGRLKEIVNRGGEKVSPREIDEALLEHPDVSQAVAFAAPHPTLGEDLVAAVVRHQGASSDEFALRTFLLNRLAGHKVPSDIVFVEAIPKGATGKVQRTSMYETLGHLLVKTFEAPRTELERSIEQVFRTVLGCGPIGVDDNFFALGGDSLKGAQVMARITAQHHVEIPVSQLFAHPTIASLAVAVEAARAEAEAGTNALAAEIEQMSDEEVARLLAEEEAGTSMEPELRPERSRLQQLRGSKVRHSGHDIIAQTLHGLGISHVYGIAGVPVDATLAACARAGIRVIGTRHQQGAVLMSLAHNYVSGALRSTVIVSAGPAVTNCATGVLVGHDNRWPLLLIGGRKGLSQPGAFQAFDGAQFFSPITKSSALVDSADNLAASISLAANAAIGGAPGPTYLDVAEEALDGFSEFAAPAAASLPSPSTLPSGGSASPIDKANIRAAATLLSQARRPAMLIGKGARWSQLGELLRRLTDEWMIPFAASPMGRGLLPDDHPLCFSDIRARMLAESDLVIVVGARLDWTFRSGSEISPQAQIIHIDIDPAEAARVLDRGVGLQGDAAVVMGQLLAECDAVDRSRNAERDRGWLDDLGAACATRTAGVLPLTEIGLRPMSPYEWLAELGAAMPEDSITVLDGNIGMAVAQRMWPVRHPGRRLGPGTNGCMGVGIPFAVGAKLARPDLPVVAVVGDFAFGLSAIELETAVRHRVPVVIVVANNAGAGGATREEAFFPADHAERVSRFGATIRHDQVMVSFGGLGRRIDGPGQIGAALSEAIARDAAVCIDVVTNENTTATAAI